LTLCCRWVFVVVMVSVVALSVVERGFIGVVMVSVLALSVVDRGFIGGVMAQDLSHSLHAP
jgi:hypothetical protein